MRTGIEQWDKPGALAVLTEIDAHINDQIFADAALKILDAWIADGIVTFK